MDAISYSYADKQAKRIKKFIENPDSSSGIVTVPKVIASGETITIPSGRVAVLPNVQVDGVLNLEDGGEVFVPSGSTYGNRNMIEKLTYVATAGQSVFSAVYDLGSIDVFVNGIRLSSSDYVATSLTSVTITGGVNAGDIVDLVSYGAFTVANTYTKSESDNLLGFKANTADLKEIGVGQTWQDVTASRVLGTTYTNTTGKPIEINCFNISSATASNATLTINGQVVASQGLTGTNGYYFVSGICPNGGTYSLSANGTSQKWLELR